MIKQQVSEQRLVQRLMEQMVQQKFKLQVSEQQMDIATVFSL